MIEEVPQAGYQPGGEYQEQESHARAAVVDSMARNGGDEAGWVGVAVPYPVTAANLRALRQIGEHGVPHLPSR